MGILAPSLHCESILTLILILYSIFSEMVGLLWQQLTFTAFILLIRYVSCLYTCTLILEAENGINIESMQRSRASGGLTALLRENSSILYQLKFDKDEISCSIQLVNVTYSNDGLGDEIQVSLNNISLGSFRTKAYSNNGYGWNKFETSNGFSKEIPLLFSYYTLKVYALATDKYGVEIDKLSLRLACTDEIHVNNDKECWPSLISYETSAESDDNEKGLSDGAIVGIISIVISTIVGVPSCVVAIIFLIRYCNDT